MISSKTKTGVFFLLTQLDSVVLLPKAPPVLLCDDPQTLARL